MNRRDFIKKVFGTAIALSVPSTASANCGLMPLGNIIEKDGYFLGKGTIYFKNTLGQDIVFPCVEFSIATEKIKERTINKNTVSFTLDEINTDNLQYLLDNPDYKGE